MSTRSRRASGSVRHAARRRRWRSAARVCAPDETHTLPLEALAAGLADAAYRCECSGASVPAEAVEEAVRRTGPAAVVLWSQTRRTADPVLARRVRATAWGVRGARVRPTVLLAGPGWRGTRLTGTVRPRGLADALALLTDPADPRRRQP